MRANFSLKTFLAVAAALVFLTLAGYGLFLRVTDINEVWQDYQPVIPPDSSKKTVYVGVISRYAPHLIYAGYQPIMDYLTAQTPYRFELRLSKDYQQTIELLRQGKVAAAFLGSYLYLHYRDQYGLQCILKPLNRNGQPFSHSVVVSSDSSFKPQQLANLPIALPSPLSFSSQWFIHALLPTWGINSQQLKKITFFNHHTTVIYALLKGKARLGVVKKRIAQSYYQKGLYPLVLSPPFPSSPIVVHSTTPPAVKQAMISALLAIDPSRSDHKAMLQHWDQEFRYGFVPAHDQDYDVIGRLLSAKGDRP